MKPNLQKITDEGFKRLGVHFGDVEIYGKENQRLTYYPEDDHIVLRYEIKPRGKSQVILNGPRRHR